MNQHAPDGVAAALAEAARAIHAPRSLEETLDSITASARVTVPGFDHVGISLTHKDGSIETKSGTGPLVWELDDLQYSLGEGPCVASIRDHPIVVVEDIEKDDRWPRYAPQAREKGLRSQLGLRLYTDERTLGGLNLYSTETVGIHPEAMQIAELFATHAALALDKARHGHELTESIASRQAIGTAIGIIMERYRIPEDRAFQFLVRASSTSNIRLRTVAEEVVATTSDRFARHEGSAS